MKTLLQRKYLLLRSRGYPAPAALWNARACSDYFWQQMLFFPMNGKKSSVVTAKDRSYQRYLKWINCIA